MVEIKIDTAKDSKEDIRKTIEFLKRFVGTEIGEREVPVKEKSYPSGSAGMFNMFGGDEDQEKQEEQIVIDRPVRDSENKEEKPEVVFKPIFY